ncbi:DUF4410 domain-containing protein [Ahniella affigens]|nr:DUF4410 domain-containing protein [Ahniella affigens]
MNRLAIATLAALPLLAAAQISHAANYDCVEVELFQPGDSSQAESREDKRAAAIPPEVLATLQQGIVQELPNTLKGMTAVKAGDAGCPDAATAISFGGTVTDYKKGNKAARYFIGLGAGKQKFAVNAWIKAKASGAVLGEDEVVDRKVGGIFGGSADKGVRDFAEKVGGFIKKTLKSKS